MIKEIVDKTIYFYDNNGDKLMYIDYSHDECVWFFYSDKEIILDNNDELYNPIYELLQGEYMFYNNDSLNCYKSKFKLIWYSDCYYNPDDIFSIKSVSRLTIELLNDGKISINCYKPLYDIFNKTDKSYTIGFSPLGNGRFSRNTKSNKTLQDDFVAIVYQSLLRNNLTKKKTR